MRIHPISGLLLCAVSLQGLAQTPDAGSLLRETERPQRVLPQPAPEAAPKAPAAPAMEGVRVTVKAFRITGNTLIPEAELLPALALWVGKEVVFGELQQALDALANEYRKRGWFVRPQLPAQDVSEGVITIHVIEGKLGALRIDDGGKTLRVDREFVSGTMTARQHSGEPLNLEYLERGSNLLNDTPGVAVTTILAAGQRPAETDAVVKVQDKPLIAGTVQLDNGNSRSTGEEKLTASASLDNPSGHGDQVTLNGNASEGSRYLKVGYSLPVGKDGLRVGVSTSALTYELVGKDFEASRSKGDAQTYGLNLNYPWLRSNTHNLSLGAALDRKDYYNEAAGLETSEKRIHAALVSLTGDSLDRLGAGGMTLWGVNLTYGDVDLSGNATYAASDANGPRTAGRYTKFGANLARLQRLSDKTTLWASINGQLANKNLDSSEELSLGGPSGVRAYPVLEGSGDEGWLATLEARYTLSGQVQLTAFYDHGHVRRDHEGGFTGALLPESGTLKGYGLGVNWSKPGAFTLRASVARRLGDNPFRTQVAGPSYGKDTDGSLDETRLWLTGIAYF